MAKIVSIEKEALNSSVLGIRFDDNKYNIGDFLPCSHDWDYENDIRSEELLDGTCALGIWNVDEESELLGKVEEFSGRYAEEYVYLISGESYQHGADDGEIIVSEAKVVGILAL